MGKNINEEVMIDGDILRCGKGTLEIRKGIRIVHLEGTQYEMGLQHGNLATASFGDMSLEYFRNVVEMLAGHTVKPLGGAVNRLLKWLYFTLNRGRIGDSLTQQISGMGEATGIGAGEAMKVIMVPDIIHYLAGKMMSTYGHSPGCSGFMARGSATSGGKLIVGRNFDFFGRGIWDAGNAVIVMSPSGGQKYCWLGCVGAPASGQGMNENGLIVSLHTKFTSDVRLTGIPLFSLVSSILEQCLTLEDAIKKIASQRRTCGLSLFIVDTKARDAAVVGFSANHFEVLRPENDVLVRTNHYLTAEMQKREVAFYAWKHHSESRFIRVSKLLEEKRGRLTPGDVPAILSDCTDHWENRKRVVGATVGAINNSESIVFSPDEDSIWIGNGKFPVCTSEKFVGFKITSLFKRDRSNYEIADLRGVQNFNETEKAAQEHYAEAWTSYLDNFRSDMAIINLRRAASLLPDEPIFSLMTAFILLTNGKYKQALPFFIKNAAYNFKSNIGKAEAIIWVGRCLDLLGRREEAVTQYNAAAAIDAPPISTAAKKHLTAPFRKKEVSKVSPEFIVGTALAKY